MWNEFFCGANVSSGLGCFFLRLLNHMHTRARAVGILWTSDHVAKAVACKTQQTQEMDLHALGGIRTCYSGSGVAADLLYCTATRIGRQNAVLYVLVCMFWDQTIRRKILNGKVASIPWISSTLNVCLSIFDVWEKFSLSCPWESLVCTGKWCGQWSEAVYNCCLVTLC